VLHTPRAGNPDEVPVADPAPQPAPAPAPAPARGTTKRPAP